MLTLWLKTVLTLWLYVYSADGLPIEVAGGAGVLSLISGSDADYAEGHLSGVRVVGHLKYSGKSSKSDTN